MDCEQFVTIVEQEIADHTPAAEAAAAAHATLQTLGERIDREEARQLAAQLPPALAPWIATATPAERFDVYEFVRRVSERENVDPAAAQRHLAERIAGGEVEDLIAHLPAELHLPLERGRAGVPGAGHGDEARRVHRQDRPSGRDWFRRRDASCSRSTAGATRRRR